MLCTHGGTPGQIDYFQSRLFKLYDSRGDYNEAMKTLEGMRPETRYMPNLSQLIKEYREKVRNAGNSGSAPENKDR